MKARPVRCICIDDDPLALDQLKVVLSDLEATVCCEYFGSPKQALKAHQRDPAEIVLSDLRLGATTGLKLIEQMQVSAPDSIYMLLSGEADLESALTAMNETHVFRFFTKPAVLGDIKPGMFDAIRELNLKKMRQISRSTLDAIQMMNTAIAVIDVSGKVIYKNNPAGKILNESGYFDIGNDAELRSINPAETKKFTEFLSSVAERGQEDSCRSTFRFTRPDSSNPIVVSVVYNNSGPGREPYFNMLICDPARKNVTSASDIATALNLTPSEARVVHGLVDGASVEDAAKYAGVSVSTARTYLKTVFSKTGVSRQAELVRLALLTAA